MWIWAKNQQRQHKNYEYLNVKLVNIDKVVDGNCVKEYFDDAWADISDLCSSLCYINLREYKDMVNKYNTRKKGIKRKNASENGDGIQIEENGEEELEEPVFTPPPIYSYPTLIDFNSQETAALMTCFSVRTSNRNTSENRKMLSTLLETNPGTIEMCGFPKTDMIVSVNQSMLLPTKSTYVYYREWLVENKGCDLPSDVTRAILMAVYQRRASSNPSISMLQTDINVLPRSILTTSDLRNMLHSNESQNQGTLLCNRSRYIYKRCEKSILLSENGTQRVYAFLKYIESTAIPLASATAKSDNGANGGSDPRVAVFNDIGEYTKDGSGCSFLYSIFDETISNVIRDFGDEKQWCLNECPDSLLHTLFLYNATLVNANRDYNLKGNNLQLLTMIMISDIGHSISYNENNIEMAKNGIGHTLHVKNFNGSIITIDANGTEDQNKTKRYGVGADNTVNKYRDAQDPRNNMVPIDIDTSKYPALDNLVGTSEMGLWYQYTEVQTGSGRKMNSITQVPPLVYCTELPVSDNKLQSSANPSASMYGKIATLIARQTETPCGAKRSFTSKNEATQTTEPAIQEQLCYMKLFVFCHNEKSSDAKAITVQAVTTPVPAASVDIEEMDYEGMDSDDESKHMALDDMGDTGKFIGTKNNPSVIRTHPFFFSVQGLAQVVISIQRIGLFNNIKDGFEGSILNILSNVVYMNKSWMTLEASCPSSRGRQNEKVQSRLPAMSVLMHATDTFLHPSISVMSWSDIVSITSINWCSNPCPSVLYPNFVSQLIANTFDWSIWLVLLVFVDYFEVPDIEIDVMDELFSSVFDGTDNLPTDKTAPLLRWLKSLGLNSNGVSDKHELMYQSEGEPLLSRTAIYVTNKWDADENSTVNTPLVVNIERNSSQYNNKDKTNSNFRTSNAWKMAETVGTKMFDKYKKQLISACNIDTVLGFVTMIYRNINRLLHYPKFGGIPCGVGFQSFDSLLKGVGSTLPNAAVYGKMNSESFVDGNNTAVRKLLLKTRSPYEIAPITIINREGTVWSMCFEIRFLILVKGLLGSRPAVSQMSIQGIFDNLVVWTIKGRIPRTIYCEKQIMTTHPDNLGSGLNILHLAHPDAEQKRPDTMIRPTPNQAVEERSSKLIPGVVNGQMPEDYLIVSAFKRIADRVSDAKLQLSYKHVHLETISPPSIPHDMWIPLNMVDKNENGIESNIYDANSAPYRNAALYVDSITKYVTLVECTDTVDPTIPITFIDCKTLDLVDKDDDFDMDSVQDFTVEVQTGKSIKTMLAADNHRFIRYCPTFNRRGILIKLPNCMFYSTVVSWPEDKIKKNRWCNNIKQSFFNPNSMTYLVKTEAVQSGLNGVSSKLWPTENELTPNVADCVFSVFTELSNLYVSVSNNLIDQYIVPVGSFLYFDSSHPAVPSFFKNNLFYTQTISKDPIVCFDNLSHKQREIEGFISTYGSDHNILPLIECMLMYELPDSVLSVDTSLVADPIWVAITAKTMRNSKEKQFVHYAVLPSRAIIDIERLHILDILPVVFQKYV